MSLPTPPGRAARPRILDQPFNLDGQTVVVGTSIGVAIFPDDGDDPKLAEERRRRDVPCQGTRRNNYQFYSRSLGADRGG